MAKLIAAYRKVPSPANRARLARYLARHSMALVMRTPEEMAFLRANGFID